MNSHQRKIETDLHLRRLGGIGARVQVMGTPFVARLWNVSGRRAQISYEARTAAGAVSSPSLWPIATDKLHAV